MLPPIRFYAGPEGFDWDNVSRLTPIQWLKSLRRQDHTIHAITFKIAHHCFWIERLFHDGQSKWLAGFNPFGRDYEADVAKVSRIVSRHADRTVKVKVPYTALDRPRYQWSELLAHCVAPLLEWCDANDLKRPTYACDEKHFYQSGADVHFTFKTKEAASLFKLFHG